MTTNNYRVGDRVRRSPGWRGTVTGFVLGGRQGLVTVRWDDEDGEWPYHPSGLEPLSAVERLGALGRTTPGDSA